jgi:hypothetical protein
MSIVYDCGATILGVERYLERKKEIRGEERERKEMKGIETT